MPRRRWGTAALVLLAGLATTCGGGTGEQTAEQRSVIEGARALLAAAGEGDAVAFCHRLSPTFIEEVAPTAGCTGAVVALNRTDGDSESRPLVGKSVGEVTVAGDTAVVILHDSVTESNPVPARFVRIGDRWVLDHVGPPAELTRVCLEEQLQVQAAVDDYFDDEAKFPTDLRELVPSRLREVPPNHAIGAKGAVEPTGACIIR